MPIISNKGGLAESKNIALVLKKNEKNNLFELLKKVTNDKKFRRSKQKLFYKKNNFNLKQISKKLDNLRDKILNHNEKNITNEQKKVLHMANFNDSADGR